MIRLKMLHCIDIILFDGIISFGIGPTSNVLEGDSEFNEDLA